MPKTIIEIDLTTRVILTCEESDNRSITATSREIGPVTDEAMVNHLVRMQGPYTVFEFTNGTDRQLLNISNALDNRIPGSNVVSTVQVTISDGEEDRYHRRINPTDLLTIRTERGVDVSGGVATINDITALNLAVQNSEIIDNRRPWQKDQATQTRPQDDWTKRVP